VNDLFKGIIPHHKISPFSRASARFHENEKEGEEGKKEREEGEREEEGGCYLHLLFVDVLDKCTHMYYYQV
jgi:hypothetical protein